MPHNAAQGAHEPSGARASSPSAPRAPAMRPTASSQDGSEAASAVREKGASTAAAEPRKTLRNADGDQSKKGRAGPRSQDPRRSRRERRRPRRRQQRRLRRKDAGEESFEASRRLSRRVPQLRRAKGWTSGRGWSSPRGWRFESKILRATASTASMCMELTNDEGFVDIVERGFDASVRLGESVHQDMVAVPLTGPLKMVVVASPEYLRRAPASRGLVSAYSVEKLALTI